jgi:hypothetical protein
MPAVRVVQADGVERADRPVDLASPIAQSVGTTAGMCPACGVGKVSAPHGGDGESMKQTIEVEIKPAVRCWVAVVRRNGVWILQAQAASESEATQEIYLRLRELRDGIDAVLREL